MHQKIHYIQLALWQSLKHIRIYGLGFLTCMVGKRLLLKCQGRLELPCLNQMNFF